MEKTRTWPHRCRITLGTDYVTVVAGTFEMKILRTDFDRKAAGQSTLSTLGMDPLTERRIWAACDLMSYNGGDCAENIGIIRDIGSVLTFGYETESDLYAAAFARGMRL